MKMGQKNSKTFRPLALMLYLSALTACGDILPTVPGTFSDVYKNTLSGTCLGCHDGTDPQKSNLDFSTQATAYATLVGTTVTGDQSSAACGSQTLVSASSPDTSYMLATLFDDYRTAFTACDAYVHETVSITDSQKSSMVDWITNGAAND